VDTDTGADEDEVAVRARARDSFARMARRAYEAAHREAPPAAPRGIRWRVEPRVVVSLAVVIAIVVAMVTLSAGRREAGLDAPAVATGVSSLPIVIDVEGAVARPGVLELPGGARVGEAIEASGGFLDDADRSALNLARPLVDGEQVYVPAQGEYLSGPVNVNRADAADLEALPGIGAVLAERIVADRAANGPFAALADLERVSGIGPAVVARLEGIATA
jgi:competence protein ComEA